MSHDLHFQVENGGVGGYPQQQGTTPGQDVPMAGELSHLPDSSSSSGQDAGTGTIAYLQQKLKQSSHPTVIVFHLLFKSLAVLFYVFGGIFVGNNFIARTVVCILLLAADFWVVKNVTGRLLVGLRWWNKVEDESTTWIFESAEDKVVNAFDRNMFWSVLYGTPLVWAGLFVLCILKFNFKWLMIVFIALSLSMANVYGYYKCSTDQKARFQQMQQNMVQQGAMAMMRSSVMGALTGSSRTV